MADISVAFGRVCATVERVDLNLYQKKAIVHFVDKRMDAFVNSEAHEFTSLCRWFSIGFCWFLIGFSLLNNVALIGSVKIFMWIPSDLC